MVTIKFSSLKELGSGSYNSAYKAKDEKGNDIVVKIQSSDPDVNDIYDRPERSVRLWNMINHDLDPKAQLVEIDMGRWRQPIKAWSCPYIEGRQATDNEMGIALIDIFNETGRIVADAISPKNFVTTNDGKTICIDVGAAIDIEIAEEKTR